MKWYVIQFQLFNRWKMINAAISNPKCSMEILKYIKDRSKHFEETRNLTRYFPFRPSGPVFQRAVSLKLIEDLTLPDSDLWVLRIKWSSTPKQMKFDLLND